MTPLWKKERKKKKRKRQKKKERKEKKKKFVFVMYAALYTLNSIYNEVIFNEKLAIMKENLCTKYFPFTYKYITLNEKPPIMKENLCIFFCYRWTWVYII